MNSLISLDNRSEAERLVHGMLGRYRSKIDAVHQRFTEIAYASHGYSTGYLPQEDKQRLLILFRMIDQTGLSFEEGLGVLLEYWSTQKTAGNRFQKKNGTLPVRVWNLTGHVSKKILEEYVQLTYPCNEHKALRREEERQTLIGINNRVQEAKSESGYTYSSCQALVRDYTEDLESSRRKVQLRVKEIMKEFRPWRGNPFQEAL